MYTYEYTRSRSLAGFAESYRALTQDAACAAESTMSSPTTTRFFKRTSNLMIREFDDELVLLETSANRIHQFNRTASHIWRLCDRASPESIAAGLAQEYDVDEEQALSDVVRTIDTFRSLNLIAER